MGIWERLENAPDGMRPARRFAWPSSNVEFTFTERVRDSATDDQRPFDSIDARARWLRQQRGSGFEYAWRGADDALLNPTWVTFRSACVDPASGMIAASGHLTHEVWDLPPAHDLGAIDGRNGGTWSEAGHPGGLYMPARTVYVGSSRTGVLVPIDADLDVVSIDLHAGTRSVAALQFISSPEYAVTVYDDSGERRVLTILQGLSGNEPIRFSGDGSWLLVTRSSRTCTVIEVASGRSIELDVGNAAWWPLQDSTLLTVDNESGVMTPRLFDIETGTVTQSFPAITLDVPALPEYPFAWFPSVSPDGREILVETPAGVTPEYQSQFGVGSRVARVLLETGAGTLVHGIFLDADGRLERDDEDLRWSAPAAPHGVHLTPALEARMMPASTDNPRLRGHWGSEAEQILVLTMNRAIGLTQAGDEVSHLVPEILVSLRTLASAPDEWAHQEEWLTGLEDLTGRLAAAGEFSREGTVNWLRIGAAIRAAGAQRPDLIDPLEAAWV